MDRKRAHEAVLLVTGAWHVPSHYRKLIDSLESRGIRTICPTLPTNNNAVPPNKTYEDDVQLIRHIAAVEAAKGTRLTVVAHSYGGAVSTAALGELAFQVNGDTIKGGVVDLLYVTTCPPNEGQSMASMFGGVLPPMFHPQPDGTLQMDNPEYFFYNDLPPEEIKKAVGMLVAHQVDAQFAPVNCAPGMAAFRVIPTSYLVCEADTAMLPQFQEMSIARLRGEGVDVRVFSCSGGHNAFMSVPDEVTEVVLKVMKSRRAP
ncbi:Alpha/beta hydrolase fold-1 [Diaporthe sp. PMI_573]|jgi:pimeloyl-ACP methyl ester carboxylesterase|nr:Alpha/beta hydrolase fold-1 [Diaporthaceae sp. PMI_573]